MTVNTRPQRAVHVRIHGHVQGVFFRAWTERNARTLGLSGWVRNRHDGSVEAVFSGGSGAVAEMLRLCRDGPPNAIVEKVELIGEAPERPSGFSVLRDA